MKNISKFFVSNLSLNCNSNKICQLHCDKYSTKAAYNYRKEPEKEKHPYKNVQLWKSFKSFSQSLIENVIYNSGEFKFNKYLL